MDARVSSGLQAGALNPIQTLKGCFRHFEEDQTILFLDAIQDIHEAKIIPHVKDMALDTYQTASDAKKWGSLKTYSVHVDGIAALMKYSAQDTDPPLYQDMNNKCYMRDRSLIAPFLKLMWLIVKSMLESAPYLEPVIYRGVNHDLSSDYPESRKFVWHGFCSCTKSMKVLASDDFCGHSGQRTIFIITLTQGQAPDIKRYSLFGDQEDEVLLPPGCRFKVLSKMNAGSGLTIVQLEELPSTAWILDLAHDISACGGQVAAQAEPAPDSAKMFDISRIVGATGEEVVSLEELQERIRINDEGAILESVLDQRVVAVGAKPLRDGDSFPARLTNYSSSIVFVGVASALLKPGYTDGWNAWMWNPPGLQLVRVKNGVKEVPSIRFGCKGIAAGDVVTVFRRGKELRFAFNGF